MAHGEPRLAEAISLRLVIPLQDSIDILGVEIDSRLRFDKHLEKVARNASLKVTQLRRVKHLFSPDDC
ncbi:hypothetical protein O3P69_013126 [Scylla paramamosain]|uniref:Uncharacterized protein n=1 Tax=Scylla paramamosain TaxID=85552 RepID=A0AAW0TYM7_SCYPA